MAKLFYFHSAIAQMEEKEKLLINRLKEGNSLAYKAVYDRFYIVLVAFASKYLNNTEDCREVVQKVFIKLFEKRESINITTSLKAYLYKATYHTAINLGKANKSFFSLDNIPESQWVTQENKLEEAEEEAEIWKAIDELPPKCKEVFMLNRFEGIKNDDISKKLNISKRTVETQISKALKILKSKILNISLLLVFWEI